MPSKSTGPLVGASGGSPGVSATPLNEMFHDKAEALEAVGLREQPAHGKRRKQATIDGPSGTDIEPSSHHGET